MNPVNHSKAKDRYQRCKNTQAPDQGARMNMSSQCFVGTSDRAPKALPAQTMCRVLEFDSPAMSFVVIDDSGSRNIDGVMTCQLVRCDAAAIGPDEFKVQL
jgi:hypothetical protein